MMLLQSEYKLRWVLETDVFSEVCFDRMIDTFKKYDIEYHIVKIIPFSHEIEGKKPDIDEKSSVVIPYGSIGIHELAERENWFPGVWNHIPNEDMLGDVFANPLNTNIRKMKLSEVSSKVTDEEFFIKPNGDLKQFAGTVLTKVEFDDWLERLLKIGYLENEDFDVVIAKPKKTGKEWRFVIVDNRISSCSLYKSYGKAYMKPDAPDDVKKFLMNEIYSSKKILPPVYVVDVCESYTDNEYKIIEVNTFNSSGLYDCDVEKIVLDISARYDYGGSYELNIYHNHDIT